MILDYKTMETTVLPNFKGGEKEYAAQMFFDGTNRIMKGKLIPGASIGLHTHETNSEMIYVLEGEGCMILDGQEEILCADMCHYCPKGHSHTFINKSDKDLIFFAVVPEQ